MVQLIEIDRLGPRVEGMLYKTAFEESWTMLDEVRVTQSTQTSWPDNFQSARRLSEAGQALTNAKHFRELLSVSHVWEVREMRNS